MTNTPKHTHTEGERKRVERENGNKRCLGLFTQAVAGTRPLSCHVKMLFFFLTHTHPPTGAAAGRKGRGAHCFIMTTNNPCTTNHVPSPQMSWKIEKETF